MEIDGDFYDKKNNLFAALFDWILYIPVNNFSVKTEWVFLGWVRCIA